MRSKYLKWECVLAQTPTTSSFCVFWFHGSKSSNVYWFIFLRWNAQPLFFNIYIYLDQETRLNETDHIPVSVFMSHLCSFEKSGFILWQLSDTPSTAHRGAIAGSETICGELFTWKRAGNTQTATVATFSLILASCHLSWTEHSIEIYWGKQTNILHS